MKIGTVVSYVSGKGLTLQIDGEEEATQKHYSFLGSYNPTTGDRVLIEEISGSYVILGELLNTSGDIADRANSVVNQYNKSNNIFLRKTSTNFEISDKQGSGYKKITVT